MFDEDDFANLINQPQVNSKYKIAPSKQSPTFKMKLNRFFQQFNKFIGRGVPKESLSGRIKELEASATEIITKLHIVKAKIKSETNQHLYAHSCCLIDPIIKEITRTDRIMDNPMSTAQEVKIFSRFVECVDKSKIMA